MERSNNAARQARYRARKADAGKVRLSVYLGENGRARLAWLADAWGATPAGVIGRLLREAHEAEHRKAGQ